MVTRTPEALYAALATVTDPEIPVLTIEDLGILRSVEIDGPSATVTITPTYSGCPAMEVIRTEIEAVAEQAGFDEVDVRTVFAPAWTTDWISESGKEKLAAIGIAPPHPVSECEQGPVACPRCREEARVVSEFGSTACKALMVCGTCREPFDSFKALR